MPSKALFYRFLNTIIDDLFSFIITMPTLLLQTEVLQVLTAETDGLVVTQQQESTVKLIML